MNKAPVKAIATGILLAASTLAAAHGGSHAESAPLHFFTSVDHMSVFALLAVGAAALLTRRALLYLRKAPSKKP